ncbi:Membrane protein ptm1 [Recurvomyces mirabilis]|nr:Membrane protein ptm1 [Recurvomyces mirabilis]
MLQPRWLPTALLGLVATTTFGLETKIDQKESNRQVCSGMYSRKSWGGSVSPFILTKFLKPDNLSEDNTTDSDPIVSIVVFEWTDKAEIGHPIPAQPGTDDNGVEERVYICDQSSVDMGYCSVGELGEFILSSSAETNSKAGIITQAIHLNDPAPLNYPIKRTGYYCVGTYGFTPDTEYTAVVEFRNAFGELPAAQIPKLPFYAALTITYAFLALAWGALYYLNRHDILPVQNYITFILLFLVAEMFTTWLFHDYQNRHGLNVGAKALLILVSILSAARNSFSFFLLLIVCMGYGVVKPTLGKTMLYVRILALTHFVFGVIYAITSLSITPENAGPLILLVVLPLAGTLTAFYIWTLNSLNLTMKDLLSRKQHVKAGMYRKLWYCILMSIVVIFAFFFVNSWTFAGSSQEDFVPKHWQTRWFILDGWLNLVYFFDVAFVAYVWRPTANNRRFAMSEEIAQDDDGFEIASIRDSFDIDLEDPTSDSARGLNGDGAKPPMYDPVRDSAERQRDMQRDVSPLPAPIPRRTSTLQRRSLEADTMFALDDEGGSDDEDDEGEGKRLTGGKLR